MRWLLIVLLMLPVAEARTLDVTVRVDDNSNSVYVPAAGAGEMPAASLTNTTYSSPASFYLASYSPSYLLALVNFAGRPSSISIARDSSAHYLTVSQDMANSNAFLVFSKGDYRAIVNRLPLLSDGSFLEYAKPTFGYGLGTTSMVQLILQYSGIDISGTDILSPGLYSLVIENKGVSAGRPVVSVRRG